MTTLFLDTETRSATSLSSRGTARYVNDPFFQVLICTWAVDDEPVRAWQPVMGEKIPARLSQRLRDPATTVVISNSSFDRRAINKSPDFPLQLSADRIHDVMVQALAHGLPGGLGELSRLFGLGSEGKIETRGRELIRVFCNPIHGSDPVRFYDFDTHPNEWDEFVEYAVNDVVAMRHLYHRLPKVNYPRLEHHLWVLDQKTSDLGLPVDVELAEAGVAEAAKERARLNKATDEATEGDVGAATQRDALLNYLAQEHDIWLPNMQSATLTRFLNIPDIPHDVKHLLELRLKSSLNAASKYRQVLRQEVHGRLHNTLQMYGASRTGRDAGRVFQPQNLMRPTRWWGLEGVDLDRAIQTDIDGIKAGVSHIVDHNVMDVLGNCVRSVIAAPKNKKFVIADLSNIEGRGLVWLSNEEWKLKYFDDFDNGRVRFDSYVMAYAKAMTTPPEEVDDYKRQIGKVMELGLGYGGGVAAFLTFVAVYNLNLKELADATWAASPAGLMEECKQKHTWAKENGYHGGLDAYTYAACEYLKNAWREAHPETVRFWYALEKAFRNCIEHDKETFVVGKLKFVRRGQWLYIRLPSGRCLVYLQPKIMDGNCSFIGWDSYKRRVDRIHTYSGKLAENVTSGVARDVMFHRLPTIDEAGYDVVLRVHDELVCETPDTSEFSYKELSRMMSMAHDWSTGLPLAADGFETKRYRK